MDHFSFDIWQDIRHAFLMILLISHLLPASHSGHFLFISAQPATDRNEWSWKLQTTFLLEIKSVFLWRSFKKNSFKSVHFRIYYKWCISVCYDGTWKLKLSSKSFQINVFCGSISIQVCLFLPLSYSLCIIQLTLPFSMSLLFRLFLPEHLKNTSFMQLYEFIKWF